MILSEAEQTALVLFCTLAGVAVVVVAAVVLWQQGRDLARLDEDVDVLWHRVQILRGARYGLLLWVMDGQPLPAPVAAPEPLAVEPDTVVAHPAATTARQRDLLHRGAHRASDGGRTVAEIQAENERMGA